MVGHGAKFGRKKEAAIAALLVHKNTEDAARAVGIGVATLRRWLKNLDFAEAYRQARRDAFAQTVGRLQQMASPAVSTLAKIMLDPNSSDASRVRAADIILDRTTKAIEFEDIEVRLSALERNSPASEMTVDPDRTRGS